MEVKVSLHLSPTFSAVVYNTDAGHVHTNVESDYEFRENRCSESQILAIFRPAIRFG
jgi:hypothetical protein